MDQAYFMFQEEEDCVHIVIRRESLAELQQLLKDDGENQGQNYALKLVYLN